MSGTTQKGTTTLELKICERCGGLWLRPAASRWIYCAGCKQKVQELPLPRADKQGKRSSRLAVANGVEQTVRRQNGAVTERVQ
jgi:hypothetical protein